MIIAGIALVVLAFTAETTAPGIALWGQALFAIAGGAMVGDAIGKWRS